ncbi:MAG: bifunctional 2-C-methyl-D-erythritol 4-phosphate cytidylyltransferase/2-C-methyl-D-erythritol 2,4-cyclodiphosphate synthase [Heliomarina sp.]|uniref:bifunctional 2-C-methyl-D-erythritol 4-phosphate cytidylyltransferase/2-C-methyl-D-erythritol 2,4-cyclodiphosphate synthase n=1 Tax=Heliomarina sp. TaxID=2917556 RepID=UPI004059AB10
MRIAALIVAAGRGTRAGGSVAKQWQTIAGISVLDHTLKAFDANPKIDRIALVLSPGETEKADRYRNAGYIVAMGGSERSISVRNGLEALASFEPDKVLIHDAARPCVSSALIERVIYALETHEGAAPALPVIDALWTGQEGLVSGTRDRTDLYRAQTPQGFSFCRILEAHKSHGDGTAPDDVTVARAANIDVAIVAGDDENLKVTMPQDFEKAAKILGAQRMVRLGNGFDVHRFGPGDHVTLCGVRVPHDRSLQGHSDADVGMHAITDAIYGALAKGDIGQHFPPSDPQWKGASSDIFLRHAVELAGKLGWAIGNVDCTLICEQPKIGPHAEDMRNALARIMDTSLDVVSVKATTSEQLGFTGRGEGIAAMATATLVAK